MCRNLEDEVDSKSIAEKRASSSLVTAIFLDLSIWRNLADARDLGSRAERHESSNLSMDIYEQPAKAGCFFLQKY